MIIVSALGPKSFFFPFWGTFIQLGCLLGQGLGLGLGPGLDNKSGPGIRHPQSPGSLQTDILSIVINS